MLRAAAGALFARVAIDATAVVVAFFVVRATDDAAYYGAYEDERDGDGDDNHVPARAVPRHLRDDGFVAVQRGDFFLAGVAQRTRAVGHRGSPMVFRRWYIVRWRRHAAVAAFIQQVDIVPFLLQKIGPGGRYGCRHSR